MKPCLIFISVSLTCLSFRTKEQNLPLKSEYSSVPHVLNWRPGPFTTTRVAVFLVNLGNCRWVCPRHSNRGINNRDQIQSSQIEIHHIGLSRPDSRFIINQKLVTPTANQRLDHKASST
jgi:hypothetical protein